MEKLSDIQREPESQLKFITDAWQQIVECRRVLKWTYAYGYYLPEREQAKMQFFEYLQGEAESALERLHQCAEKELLQFLSAEGPSKEFVDFHTKLAGLTGVTKNYFQNLVMALEKGLCDVDSQAACGGSTIPAEMYSTYIWTCDQYRTTIPRLPHVPSPLVSILASCVPESVGEKNLRQAKNKCTIDDGFFGTKTMMV